VLQTLVDRVDRGLGLVDAIAAPRASQRNAASADAEPAFLERYGEQLQGLGHAFTPTPEIGAATGIEFLPDGRLLAAAETTRRGGGSAGVVHPLDPVDDVPDLAPRLGDQLD
jgi:gamma-glutamyltranspeptidase/glutathione hydrolase